MWKKLVPAAGLSQSSPWYLTCWILLGKMDFLYPAISDCDLGCWKVGEGWSVQKYQLLCSHRPDL